MQLTLDVFDDKGISLGVVHRKIDGREDLLGTLNHPYLAHRLPDSPTVAQVDNNQVATSN